MTGSSNYQFSNNPTDSSVSAFGDALRDQTTRPPRNAFISFHIEDEDQVNLLRHQSKDNEFGLHFRDYSIKEPFDNAWKTQCKEQIARTSATIVMIGPETANREAVLWEINESLRQGKKVIGVRIYKDANHPIPQPMLDSGCRIVEWKLARISKILDEN